MFWNVRQDNLKCSREESLLLWGLRVEPDVWKAGNSKMKGKGTFLRLMSFERPGMNLKVGVYPVDGRQLIWEEPSQVFKGAALAYPGSVRAALTWAESLSVVEILKTRIRELEIEI